LLNSYRMVRVNAESSRIPGSQVTLGCSVCLKRHQKSGEKFWDMAERYQGVFRGRGSTVIMLAYKLVVNKSGFAMYPRSVNVWNYGCLAASKHHPIKVVGHEASLLYVRGS
jgi:hypothetical protein